MAGFQITERQLAHLREFNLAEEVMVGLGRFLAESERDQLEQIDAMTPLVASKLFCAMTRLARRSKARKYSPAVLQRILERIDPKGFLNASEREQLDLIDEVSPHATVLFNTMVWVAELSPDYFVTGELKAKRKYSFTVMNRLLEFVDDADEYQDCWQDGDERIELTPESLARMKEEAWMAASMSEEEKEERNRQLENDRASVQKIVSSLKAKEGNPK